MNSKTDLAKEKPMRNPHLKGVTKLKCQALADGFFGNSMVIKGEVFYITEKVGRRRVSKYADYTEKFINTVADQFSPNWMVELERGEGGDDDVDILNNAELKERRQVEELKVARASEASEARLPEQPLRPRQPLKPIEETPVALTPAQKAANTRAANKAKKLAEDENVVVSEGNGEDVI